MKPNDLKGINYEIKQIEEVGEKIDRLRQEIEIDHGKCFTKSGKIQSGEECAHHFNEKCLSKINCLKDRIADALSRMKSCQEKHMRMYPVPAAKQGTTSRKRRRKENTAKTKKRKLDRQEKNCRRVYGLVTLTEATCCYGDTVDTSQLTNLESLSKLKKNEIHWLKKLMEKKMFTRSAVSGIRSVLSPYWQLTATAQMLMMIMMMTGMLTWMMMMIMMIMMMIMLCLLQMQNKNTLKWICLSLYL